MAHAEYQMDDESYDAIAEAGLDVLTVIGALHGPSPKVRRLIGSDGLNIYARANGGRWIAMAFVEASTDDMWLLTKVRVLSEAETTYIRHLLEGEA